MKSRLLFHSKDVDDRGDIVEIKIWQVPSAMDKPHGLKYSLAYVVGGARIVGYDNAEGKGDHKHLRGRKLPYEFSSVEKLFDDFQKDIKRSGRP